MNHNSIHITLFALLSIVSMSVSPLVEATINGFTIDLIHRDSPQSPFHDPSLLPLQRLHNSLRRSFSRAHRFKRNDLTESPSSNVISVNGEYVMEYSIGTPPVPSVAVADTGSDLIWTQCSPCQCFDQKLPLFETNKSSTYKTVPCDSTKCHTLSQTTCNVDDETCSYSLSYGDRSFTYGNIATDTITLGTVSVPDVTFGCGRRNGGIYDGGESGIVGLGGGRASLVSQLGPSIEGKFSYCLVSYLSNVTNSSKLNFGKKGKVSGEGVVSTPIVPVKPETYYYLTLEGVSVGNVRFEFSDSPGAVEEGNIFIDSGTTLTFLPLRLYTKLETAVASMMKLDTVSDPQEMLDLCYYTTKDVISVPDLTFHFKGGADVILKPENSFTRTSNHSVCLALAVADNFAIYGNLAQINFLIGYDLEKKTVSFKPMDCTKYT